MLENSVADRLRTCLLECLQVLSNNKTSIPLVLDKIQEALERLSQPMQLAIIGKISSSKSTLVNAILGKDEVVRTGQMEETFNVSWLKFGDTNADIKVVFKNGDIRFVPHNDWENWTSHQYENILKEQVKYIEVSFEDSILKNVNIIDTPGLDALSEIDSKNTISFLKEIKPDAIIMLFTKSIAESTFSILQDFQNMGSNSFSLSPLNAIGVLSKIDTMWSSMNPDKNIIEDAKRVIQYTLYDKYPEVKKSLFSILPVSSLLGLSSATITEEDFDSIKCLSAIDRPILCEMLSSPDLFIDDDYRVNISSNKRLLLYRKFGLYGIYILVKSVLESSVCTLDQLKQILREKSGFDTLMSAITNHFGDRAALIKSYNTILSLMNACSQVLSRSSDNATIKVVEQISKKITIEMLSIHEFQEWKYLSEIYEHKGNYNDAEVDEFKALCGEYGNSVIERLQVTQDVTVCDMTEKIKVRALYWQKQYNIYSDIDPKKAAFYKVILGSYNNLLQRIETVSKEVKRAKDILNNANMFFLGVNAKIISEVK